MSKSKSHAEREFEILQKTTPDAIILPFKDEILALVEAVGESGQSGGSMPFTASAVSQSIQKLLMQTNISPLTGADEEWSSCREYNDDEELYQNIRDSRVFKDSKDGRAYFIDAIIFDGDIGGTFTGGDIDYKGKKISSVHYIKEFPFTPKSFYVDVIEERFKDEDGKIPDENGDFWESKLKDESQLDEVFEYYDIMEKENK